MLMSNAPRPDNRAARVTLANSPARLRGVVAKAAPEETAAAKMMAAVVTPVEAKAASEETAVAKTMAVVANKTAVMAKMMAAVANKTAAVAGLGRLGNAPAEEQQEQQRDSDSAQPTEDPVFEIVDAHFSNLLWESSCSAPTCECNKGASSCSHLLPVKPG